MQLDFLKQFEEHTTDENIGKSSFADRERSRRPSLRLIARSKRMHTIANAQSYAVASTNNAITHYDG